MATFKRNLGKISPLSGGGTLRGTVILGLFIIIFLGGNVATKSLSPSSIGVRLDNKENENDEYSTTVTSTTTPSPSNHFILDIGTLPEVKLELNKSSTASKFTISRASPSADYRIAVHLKDCDFDDDDFIEIKNELGENKPWVWHCDGKGTSNDFSPLFTPHGLFSDKHSGDRFVTVKEVRVNLTEFRIVPKFRRSNQVGKRSKQWRATIIINLYKDIRSSKCPSGFFNCYQPLCSTSCCSDVGSSSGNNDDQKVLTAFWPTKNSDYARCIPNDLTCNDNPNCGMYANSDERNQICHPDEFCKCESENELCLTWNYVLTSLAIAVLFIITPTAIVFALFHRRNVALERARLLRLAQMRMADMRGEFTRDSPTNDHPPTYDEVYDIKEPPPCFCQALAMQREYDSRQEQENHTNAGDPTTLDDESDTFQPQNFGIEFQNLGFQCSCRTVSGDDEEGKTQDLEIRGENNGDILNDDIDHHNDNHNGDTNRIQNARPLHPAPFENIDLDKEENV